MKTCFT